MSDNIRIQKLLANLGFGSRRNIEELIRQRFVKVNATVCKLGDKASLDDVISIKNKHIKITKKLLNELKSNIQVLLYNKPEGEVCSRDDEKGRKNVFSNLPKLDNGKWVSVGRLDINTSGLLLFTNNGDYANKLMHPSSNIEREYLVKTSIVPTSRTINNLKKGVKLEDGFAKFVKLKPRSNKLDNKWFSVVITEGRNREVRRLWESQGLMVSKLIRIRFDDYILPKNLAKGKYKYQSLIDSI